MPISTTYQRRRRQATDDIEDAAPSQTREDVDDEEEVLPPRPAKGSKRHKKPQAEQHVYDAAEEEEDDPLASFVDQPVDRQQASRISGLAQDWEQARKNFHQPSYALVRDIAGSLAEFTEGDKAEKV